MADVQNLLARASANGTPVIDGVQATFIWQGETAPQLIADFNEWGSTEAISMQETAPGVWTYTRSFPADAYIEYRFIADPDEPDEFTPDPLNADRVISNGVGSYNHFFYMPEGGPSPLRKRQRGVKRGRVTRHTLETYGYIAGKERAIWLYQPPTTDPVPLLLVYDGNDYRSRAGLVNVVDNLIAQGRMRPVALAMVANKMTVRMTEYNSGEMIIAFVMRFVLPLARQKLNLIDAATRPGAYGVLGASMGGLMALYTAMRMPHIFGHVVSQSGAFLPFYDDAAPLYRVLIDTFTNQPPLKIWLDVGRYEWLNQANQALQTLLQARGWDVTFHEFSAGHNYTAWANVLELALPTVFAPLENA
ncbi:MAG: alpha/beta hydrolase-fold protein [Chloroflexota bacterium]